MLLDRRNALAAPPPNPAGIPRPGVRSALPTRRHDPPLNAPATTIAQEKPSRKEEITPRSVTDRANGFPSSSCEVLRNLLASC